MRASYAKPKDVAEEANLCILQKIRTRYSHARVALFSWNCVFEDTYGRGTILKVNLVHELFQFIVLGTDYGVGNATRLRRQGLVIVIRHYDNDLRLTALAVRSRLDFCFTIAWDLHTFKRYSLVDTVGTE